MSVRVFFCLPLTKKFIENYDIHFSILICKEQANELEVTNIINFKTS